MKPILRLEQVSKRFGGVVAADDMTFELMPGKVKGLIGPNGAGKSTLLNLISGIYAPDGGDIYFDERKITQTPAHKRARMGIGRTFQTPRFLQRSSIRDNFLLGTDLGDKLGYFKSYLGCRGSDFDKEFEKLLQITHLEFDWEDDINSLPFGKRKLLEIVRAMLAHPRVMLIDEPAAGLNNKEGEYVMDMIRYASREQGIGVMLIEHSMEMVMNICDDIVVLSFGKVIAKDEPKAIATNPVVIEAYLGEETDD